MKERAYLEGNMEAIVRGGGGVVCLLYLLGTFDFVTKNSGGVWIQARILHGTIQCLPETSVWKLLNNSLCILSSIGKFDKKLPGEKPAKKLGKHRKFLPVVDGEGKEKELLTNVMRKVLAENDFSGFDVNKAVRAHNVEESGKPSQKKIGGKKRADGAFKKGGSQKGMSPGGKPGRSSQQLLLRTWYHSL